MKDERDTRTYPPTESFVTRDESNALMGIKETHPSYGTISISHVYGQVPLFNSDIQHNHFVEITVQEASKYIDGDREIVMGHGKSLVRVWLSAAQFAELITTPNRGSGTPCTIRHAQGDPQWNTRFGDRPEAPKPQPFADRFKDEGKRRAQLMNEHMHYAKSLVDKLVDGTEKPTKANLKDVAQRLAQSMQEIQSNLPYVMECMEEATEKRMQNAVTEFESYVGTRLRTMGLEHLQATAPKLPSPTYDTLALPEPDRYYRG
jgi:hypothetical protein